MDSSTAARIVDVARTVLVEEGADAVSMRRIATAVGITPMAIYRHFANREALLATVADQSFAELGQAWDRSMAAGDTPAEVRTLVTEALDQHLDFALRQPKLYAFLFTERRADARRFPDDFVAGQSPTFTVLTTLLTKAMRVGLIPTEETGPLALIIAAELHGLVQLQHGGRIGMAEAEFRAFCHRTVWRILRVDPT